MTVLLTIDSISRRSELSVFPRVSLRVGEAHAINVTHLARKAAEKYKKAHGITGGVRFEFLDDPQWVTYADIRAVVVVMRIRSNPMSSLGVSRDLSGVVELRISGLPEEFKI